MTDRKDGGPAFPRPTASAFEQPNDGMSLRDWFAGRALTGLLMQDKQLKCFDEMATWAYQAADAMLAEREKDR